MESEHVAFSARYILIPIYFIMRYLLPLLKLGQQQHLDIERLTSFKSCEENLKKANECENCLRIVIIITKDYISVMARKEKIIAASREKHMKKVY